MISKLLVKKGFCKLQCLHFWLYFILFWCPNALICVVFIVFYLLWNFILYNKKMRVINHNLIRIVLHFFYCTIIVSKLLNLIVSLFLIYHIEKSIKFIHFLINNVWEEKIDILTFFYTYFTRSNFLIVNSVINEV